MKNISTKKWTAILSTLLLFLLSSITYAESLKINSSAFSKLAIQSQGRIKPFTVFAHETLLTISGSSKLKTPQGKQTSLNAVISMWLNPLEWKRKPLILISSAELKQSLNFEIKQKLFSLNAISSHSFYQKSLQDITVFRMRNPRAPLPKLLKEVENIAKRIRLLKNVLSGEIFCFTPPPDDEHTEWVKLSYFRSYYPENVFAPFILTAKEKLFQAFKKKDSLKITHTAEQLEAIFKEASPDVYPSSYQLKLEHIYTFSHPFRIAWISYLLSIITFAFTFRWKKKKGYRWGWLLLGLGFLSQLLGFSARIIISGRAPVTNMYESVIWVAFGAMLFAIFFESRARSRIFMLATTPFVILCLVLTDLNSAILNPAIVPIAPVLRDNFWLTTHVLSITLSYAAFLIALGLGCFILIRFLVGKQTQVDTLLCIHNYRVLQVGVLLLATGTLLGGVWANYAWGRFWDWDPKETWALITLLIYLATLHGRLAGWWGGFGLALGSVIGFLSVLMAWYGVNFFLGTGLHSYGFGQGGGVFISSFCGGLILLLLIVWIKRSGSEKPEKI